MFSMSTRAVQAILAAPRGLAPHVMLKTTMSVSKSKILSTAVVWKAESNISSNGKDIQIQTIHGNP